MKDPSSHLTLSKYLYSSIKSFKELLLSEFISFTILVPESVPSLTQRSNPLAPSSAIKYNLPLNSVKRFGELSPLGFISFTILESIPSLTHSSVPLIPSSAVKKTFSPKREIELITDTINNFKNIFL